LQYPKRRRIFVSHSFTDKQKKYTMYTLIQPTKETQSAVFFQAEHNELETLHTIEVQKEKIQGYLEYCGQNSIPDHAIENIMNDEITLDICQDIIKFGKDDFDYFVVGGTACVPPWTPSTMYHNKGRFSPYVGSQSNPSRGEIVVDGYVQKAYSAKVHTILGQFDHLKTVEFAPQTA